MFHHRLTQFTPPPTTKYTGKARQKDKKTHKKKNDELLAIFVLVISRKSIPQFDATILVERCIYLKIQDNIRITKQHCFSSFLW